MNTKREFDRIVSDWLDERVAEPPRSGLDDALEHVTTTRQHRRRWLERWISRGRDALRSARDRGSSHHDERTRRDKIMLSATALVAGVAVLAIGATLVLPIDRSGSAVIPGAGTGAIYIVAQDGSGDFSTIGEALAAAVDGDTIRVSPGTYAEAITITEDVTLEGEGSRDNVVIQFPSDAPGTDFLGADVPVGIRLVASDATLGGLTVASVGPGLAVLVEGGSPELSDLAISFDHAGSVPDDDAGVAFAFVGAAKPLLTDSAWAAYLAVRDGAGPTIQGNTITANTISVDGPGETILRDNTLLDGASTSLSAGATGIVEGNDLTGGNIAVDTGSDIVVRGNTVRGFLGNALTGAIEVRDAGSKARIVGNHVSGSTAGIVVQSDTEASVEDNELEDNDIGMTISSTDASVVSNTVTGSRVGLLVASLGTIRPVIEGNVIESSETGISLGATARITLTRNTLCDNEVDLRVYGNNPTTLDGNEVCPPDASPVASG